ncbi:MAG: cation diffusion facilitator family transporter [Thermodesulfovibrionales bacterium]
MASDRLTSQSIYRRLSISFGVTLLILAAEVAGGLISNSIALLSDAGHMLTDAFALGLSLIAARVSRKPSDLRATYGYQRVGLLAAVINGVSLVAIAVFIFFESYERFVSPPEINTPLMLGVAAGGLAANLFMAYILGKGHHDLNLKSAWLHVLGDTLSSVGVVAAGIVIYFTGWRYADPVAGALIGVIVITGGVRVVREALHIFLDLVPRGYNVEAIAQRICGLPEVLGVHDVHMRSLSHGRIHFSAHVWVHDQKLSEAEGIRRKIEEALKEIGISHILLQLECAECQTNGLFCQVHEEEDEDLHHGHAH